MAGLQVSEYLGGHSASQGPLVMPQMTLERPAIRLQFGIWRSWKIHRLVQGTQPPAAGDTHVFLRGCASSGADLLSPTAHLPTPPPPVHSGTAVFVLRGSPGMGHHVLLLVCLPEPASFGGASTERNVLLSDLPFHHVVPPSPAPDRPNSGHKSAAAGVRLPQTGALMDLHGLWKPGDCLVFQALHILCLCLHPARCVSSLCFPDTIYSPCPKAPTL